jgi:membrane dipeptidase
MQGKDAVRATLEQIDVVHQMAQKYPNTFRVVGSLSEFDQAFSEGLIPSLIGMEGGHSLDGSFGALRQFYATGARYLTLTHTCNNEIGDSSANGCADNNDCRKGTCVSGTCSEIQTAGITEFGKETIREMNRLGMFVDLSHVSPTAMKVALEVTRAPVIFSHSSAKALCPVERNVPNEILLKVQENGGVVMVTFVPSFVSPTGNINFEFGIQFFLKLLFLFLLGSGKLVFTQLPLFSTLLMQFR